MRKLLSLLVLGAISACSGEKGDAGPKGDPGDPLNGSGRGIGLVFPLSGILDREADVLVTVNNVSVDSTAVLDFGAGIKVTNIAAATPTTLTAHLSIGKDAALGKHDVKVTAADATYTATAIYNVRPAIEVSIIGDATQGGLIQVDINNNDVIPFDSQNFNLTAPGLMSLGGSVEGTNGTYYFIVEPKATLGKQQFVGSNSPSVRFLGDPNAFTILAGTPLDISTAKTGESIPSNGTKFYKVSIPAGGTNGSLLSYNLKEAAGQKLLPVMQLFAAGGKQADILAQQSPPSGGFGSPPPASPFDLTLALPVAPSAPASEGFLIVYGQDDAGGKFDLAPSTLGSDKITAVTEGAAAHATAALAQDLTGIPASTNALAIAGEITSSSELDIYSFPAAIGDRFELIGAPGFDAYVFLTKTPASTSGIFAGSAIGGGMVDDKVSKAASATDLDSGKLYLVVQSDPDGAKQTGKYRVVIRRAP